VNGNLSLQCFNLKRFGTFSNNIVEAENGRMSGCQMQCSSPSSFVNCSLVCIGPAAGFSYSKLTPASMNTSSRLASTYQATIPPAHETVSGYVLTGLESLSLLQGCRSLRGSFRERPLQAVLCCKRVCCTSKTTALGWIFREIVNSDG
jgi:hypothetical protein